ncbi:MAG: class I SAM-dependent methyltransferase [Paludisphaera borealis]|uniref:THUMP-like domain-containing protein n=1 Tax=Paludisphaera borealis TaxID=1387353 RepID=UPI0028485FE5|nr:class I SAM-dependent methyltransferase [Paludisphaera borealis]MDR3622968.1 class I SAM-dependent methyltransferase [Paludisphaera borealis]
MSFYSETSAGSTQDRREHPPDASDAEFTVLTTDLGRDLLDRMRDTPNPGPADVMRWRKLAPAEIVSAAVRLSAGRRKGLAKFARAEAMWLDPVGLEQATAEAVAEHKAKRFEADVVVDLCSGIGGDALALAARADVIAVDRDPGMGRRIAWNARVYDRADRILPCQASAEAFPIPPAAWVHVDPDRRTSGKGRTVALEGYAPGPEFLRALMRTAPGGAIKLGPASDFARFTEALDCEVELISLDGECKEATVWFGAAARASRSAVKLPENVAWNDREGDGDRQTLAFAAPVGRWIYEPDTALTRSGLLDSFANAHGLFRIAYDLPYLTSDELLATPWLEAFEVQSVHPLDLKRLKRLIADESLGPVTVKHKTTKLTPETIRPLLRSTGELPTTLFLTGGSGPGRAIVARKV